MRSRGFNNGLLDRCCHKSGICLDLCFICRNWPFWGFKPSLLLKSRSLVLVQRGGRMLCLDRQFHTWCQVQWKRSFKLIKGWRCFCHNYVELKILKVHLLCIRKHETTSCHNMVVMACECAWTKSFFALHFKGRKQFFTVLSCLLLLLTKNAGVFFCTRYFDLKGKNARR